MSSTNNIRSKMAKRKATKSQIRRERNSAKIKKVLKQKGYKSGKLPKTKVLHHIKSVAEKGKTTKKNIRIVKKAKHKTIHANRRKRGKI